MLFKVNSTLPQDKYAIKRTAPRLNYTVAILWHVTSRFQVYRLGLDPDPSFISGPEINLKVIFFVNRFKGCMFIVYALNGIVPQDC